MNRRHRVTARILLVSYSFTIAGCYTWSQPPAGATLESTVQDAKAIRLVLANGDKPVMQRAFLLNDSIVDRPKPGVKQRAIARDSVAAFQTRSFSAGKTVLAGLGVIVAVPILAFGYLIVCQCFD